jgi:hypothetical protein
MKSIVVLYLSVETTPIIEKWPAAGLEGVLDFARRHA